MKRIAACSLLLFILLSFAACSNEGGNTVSSTTAPSKSTISTTHADPRNKLEAMMAAYNAYCSDTTDAQEIGNIIFRDGDACYIIIENDKVYPFFMEAADESTKVYESVKFTLYYSPDLSNVMVLAMQNAWNAYSAQCAQDRTEMYDLSLYLFECEYFSGVYGIDENNQLVQNLVREGVNCGTFGPFTIYLPNNPGQSQPGTMTDGERIVIIRNIYSAFVAQAELDAVPYLPIEAYIFACGGEYFQIDVNLERPDLAFVGELATEKIYDGWRIYLPNEDAKLPLYDDIVKAYNAFAAAAGNSKVKPIEDYLYYDGKNYYSVDEWYNVITVSADKAGKAANTTPFEGFTLYKKK